ncbi:MAG TPA: anthranilate phosphoribosyltransferase [Methanothrix sp.]|nr:anthranilate phosphoribosyltransferase [Methanothrix sp.]HRW82301.1 anthranilate phosphoribosyltransferase [Methanothrix sp.]
MDDAIGAFGSKLNRLIEGKSLTREEARDMFSAVLNDEQPDAHQGAFLAAITAKGPTPEEIAGAWEAIIELDTFKVSPRVTGDLFENCGTGMDAADTFNISTAASIVAAAAGVTMAKHGARAITSRCGTVDILEVLGVDVEADPSVVTRSIEGAGIGIFNGMSPKVHPGGLGRILSKIRFGTILNVAGSLANPAMPRRGVRGVYSKEMVLPLAEAMRMIGYRRAMVVFGLTADGERGMDEVSPSGKTFVAELREDGRIETFNLWPEDFGAEPIDERYILPREDRIEEATELLRVLSGEERGPRETAVCINSAPILYIAGKSRNLSEGFSASREILRSGKAIEKLGEWVSLQNSDPAAGSERLERLVERALN